MRFSSSLAILIALSLVFLAPAAAFEGEYVLLDDDAIYPMLLRLRALGAPIREDLSSLPLTRGDAVGAVRATRRALDAGELRLPGSARAQLRYLERELAPELGAESPERYHELSWPEQRARVRFAVRARVSVTGLPDPDFEPDPDGGSQSTPTDLSLVIEPLPEATLLWRDRLLVQQRLNFYYLIGDGVRAASFDVSQGEAVISEGEDDNVLFRRSFDTVGRLLLGHGVAIEAGRLRFRWGHGRRGTLLISDYTPPVDFVRVVGRIGRMSFTSMATELRTTIGQRYMATHRLSYNTPHLTISMSESVIFGNRAFDFAYISPFQLLVAVEDNIGAEDNNILGADVRWRPANGLELWLESILDDWNLRHGFDYFANKIAFQVGTAIAGLPGLPDTDLELEYTLVDQFTYSHVDSINRATHYDGIVGHRIGTDAELFTATATHWIGARLRAFARFEQERHGEGDVTIDHRSRDGDRHRFLTGTLETTRSAEVGVRFRTVRGIAARASYRRSWTDRLDNDPDAPRVARSELTALVKLEF